MPSHPDRVRRNYSEYVPTQRADRRVIGQQLPEHPVRRAADSTQAPASPTDQAGISGTP